MHNEAHLPAKNEAQLPIWAGHQKQGCAWDKLFFSPFICWA
jgi:hypothetical protein